MFDHRERLPSVAAAGSCSLRLSTSRRPRIPGCRSSGRLIATAAETTDTLVLLGEIVNQRPHAASHAIIPLPSSSAS